MNEKFLVGKFQVGNETKEVYLLNPGDCFQGFGGSSAGLVVKKTASLIVREVGPGGCYDTEYDVNDKKVWGRIFNVVRTAKEVA